jgi:hypothetical protein
MMVLHLKGVMCSAGGFKHTVENKPGTTNAMLTSFMIYSWLKSMMSFLLRIITNVMLGLLLSLRSITMRRSLTFPRIIIRRKMVGLLGTNVIGIKTCNLKRQ